MLNEEDEDDDDDDDDKVRFFEMEREGWMLESESESVGQENGSKMSSELRVPSF